MFSRRLLALYGAMVSLLIFAGCSGGGTTSPLPAQPIDAGAVPVAPGVQTSGLRTALSTTATGLLTVKGYIDDTRSDAFHVEGGPGVGYIWVYVSTTTQKSYNGLTPKAGVYAVVSGTGSLASHIDATSAALYTSASAATATKTRSTATQSGLINVQGYIDDLRTDGFHVQGGPGVGYIWVYTNSSSQISYNGLTPKIGQYLVASGTGSLSTSLTAVTGALYTSAAAAGSAAPAPTAAPASSGVPTHILTAEYLEGLYGTFAVTPAQAAPYLSWAQTTTNDTVAIHDAGIKTQVYVDPNWLATTDPLYPGSLESNFSHTCSGSRVLITFGTSSTRNDTNPASATNHTHFADWVAAQQAAGHVDMIFEDNGGPLSPYASYPKGMPCGYSTASWITGANSLNNAASVPVMMNGLNEFTTTTAPNLSVVLNGGNTVAGNLEGCYNDLNKPVETGNSWLIMEDTEIDMIRAGKLFECMGRDQGTASTNTTGRIFTLASFLLTYDPNHAMLAEEWATPSKFRVMPETGLVVLNPRVAEPTSIAGIKQATGAYGREYSNCYYRGTDIGACAVAVTHDFGRPEPFPFTGYTRTLTVTGSGVLDGGTVSTHGPPPPTTMQPYTAVIAFK